MKEITKEIFYVGVNDHELDLFEGQFDVPNGMAYNSYVIVDDKIAVMDTVDVKFGDQWLANIEEVLNGKSPDYLIVQHMEPDHSANIMTFVNKYPQACVVGNVKTFKFMEQFFGTLPTNRQEVKEGEALNLGHHVLNFVFAPMVHWPEVMFTYDSTSHTLFSADAFGKFGALDVEEDWACEARRYYFGIVGKYGVQVQSVLKKAASLNIETICPLHGPVLTENLSYYLNLYQTWSSYQSEVNGIFIAYTSVYGNTKKAVLELEKMLKELTDVKVTVSDLARSDMHENIEDAFKYSKIVLATTTYNNGIFPFMETFLNNLEERMYQNKVIGLIENGTWAPVAGKVMKEKLSKLKNIEVLEPTVKILSSLNEESKAQLKALAEALTK